MIAHPSSIRRVVVHDDLRLLIFFPIPYDLAMMITYKGNTTKKPIEPHQRKKKKKKHRPPQAEQGGVKERITH
jgi:hypothetical protein